VIRRCSSEQATQERRGATVAARTAAFLFARACNGRDTPRAFAGAAAKSVQQAMQERRGATVAARTVAFLFARACNGRDTARAFRRTGATS